MLIIVSGLPGTGKTTLAKQLSEGTNAKILRTDLIRKNLFEESTLEEVISSNEPLRYNLEMIFDRQETIPRKYQELIWKQKEMVYAELLRITESLLMRGETVVLDGTFYKKNLREKFYSIARNLNLPFYLVECHCSERIIENRLEARKQDPDDGSFVDKMHIYKTMRKLYESPLLDLVPVIKYDTGRGIIKTYNIEPQDGAIYLILESIRTVIDRFS